jgi:hypothetical protein
MFLGLLLTVAGSPGIAQREPDNKKEKQPDNKKEKAMLECRVVLVRTSVVNGKNEVGILEAELKNVSEKPIDIRYTCLPPILQYMAIEIERPDGKVLKYKYADNLSPYSLKPLTKTIDPGKMVRADFGAVGGTQSGVYRIRAFIAYETMKLASPVLEIELKPLD